MDTNSYHEAATHEQAAKARASHDNAARSSTVAESARHFPEGQIEFGRGWYHDDAMKSAAKTVAHKA